ncbi:cell division cycle-associated protein 2 isoform X1 [Podarcis raffonei]|uniref:cell division cycle-associated protein 2 isoform X1 n=1 Tax=Podarcis raffonei TaxID=65483 RepID=UPI002329158F|nr:cell division cycle-associated protein 2 isoform X1 [Podarcis raffonei]XP_053222485.1 cell division cycle-associated protein 2 isoform X1 [Podarcis raffonei]XP_053222486.1 cell division cycle-associated protein 2 isoform X1 [Podarcis raffonei]XP_053222488.1 cell division cycle-associated protein 2 isoform X1 [Podarcis raffonei]XP_053222489.1 cell division cycle-associated protein 2 isoform X1 [Podarcis raffonei]XP_053222490.1 cell division cycle-associated protein 2 isoform X1 [Podarcis raf
MICITYKSKAVKTFPMETRSNRKVLSECSNVQTNLHLGLENCIDSTKKADSCSSDALTVDMSTMYSNAGSHLVEDHPTTLGDTDYLTPNKNGFDSTYGISSSYASPPVDFSALTAADFGITPKSFTKQNKGDSENLLKKFRRRSTIGVRGSPENNSLIQYIAHQKRIKKQDTLASPLQCRNTWLKDKIAAFQFSFKPLEESKESAIHITGSSMKTETSLHEQSKVGLSECKDFEGNRHWKSVSRGRTPADIQVDSTVSSLQKHLISTTAVSKVIPVLQADTRESGCIPLEATPDKSKAVCELSSNATSNQSCKKVRFAEKQSLEIFDGNKPPITPIQKEQLPSNSLHSALKKTPVTTFTEDMKGHLDKRTEEGSEVLPDCENFETLQIDRPLRRRREAMFSASGSREKSSIKSPDKQPSSQPNFDYLDELLQQSPDVSTSEYAVNSDLEETKNSNPAFQATSTRTTRSSAKRKSINKAEEMALNPTKKTLPKSTKFQKAEAATKSTEKRTAVRSKVFGKRRRRKKKEKALYGERQTVSKKPLLSPIPEMTEDFSFISSYQSTPKSEVSIFDNSSSSVLNAENQPNIQDSSSKDNSCLHSSLNLVTEDALPDNVSGSSSQLLDTATNDMKDTLPWNPLEKSSPEKPKSCYFPSVEDFESKTPGNNPSVPRDNVNKLPPWTVNDSELLDNLQCSIEESFMSVTRSNKKRVRRSMRLLKDAENDGLAWIQMPDDNVLGQAILGSAGKARKRKSTSHCPEVEPLHPKQGTGDQMLLPMKEGQKKTHVAMGPSESRRKSISVPSLEGNQNATLRNQRNRRRSLGYKSDRCYQKDLINQKII